jgi:antitoxin ParD1/3/4
MNISLTPELERLVNDKVKTGMYPSASEVIREGLRLLQEQDELRKIRLSTLKREIAKGIAQADRGEVVPARQVFDETRRRNNGRRQKK